MEDFVAGALGGAMGLLIGHPFEVLKVQLQVSPRNSSGSIGFKDSLGSMMSRGVSSGLYRGLAMPMASFAAVNSVFFGVYGHTISTLERLRPEEDCRLSNVVLAGMAGGAAQLPLVAPVELVKTAMQAQLSRQGNPSEFFRGPLHCAASILRREGPRGLTRGFCLTFVRDVPSYGLYMLFYDWLDRRLAGRVTGTTAATLLAGGLAGSVSWLSILPIDTVKSNLQAEAGFSETASGRAPAGRPGAAAVARRVFRDHGLRGFFRGGLVVAVRSFPVNAVTFFVWDRSLQFMKRSQCSN